MKSVFAVVALSAIGILTASASFAQDSKIVVTVVSPNAIPVDASPQTLEAEKEVCRKPRPLIGTRFPGPTICKTQRQWDTEMHSAQHIIGKWQIKGCLPNGSCPQ
ncbi:MAG TPA: hypothetical protein VMF67_11350 [Rhizomicrobium sp.]|nr:hypothetical protein [Rhizomicrobium sp.]